MSPRHSPRPNPLAVDWFCRDPGSLAPGPSHTQGFEGRQAQTQLGAQMEDHDARRVGASNPRLTLLPKDKHKVAVPELTTAEESGEAPRCAVGQMGHTPLAQDDRVGDVAGVEVDVLHSPMLCNASNVLGGDGQTEIGPERANVVDASVPLAQKIAVVLDVKDEGQDLGDDPFRDSTLAASEQ